MSVCLPAHLQHLVLYLREGQAVVGGVMASQGEFRDVGAAQATFSANFLSKSKANCE